MQKQITRLEEIRLVGITIRTNNANEMNPETGKIGPTVQKYFKHGLAEKIINRKNPGTTFCVYTNYESDVTGEYTYFVGEEVTAFGSMAEGLETLTIPTQNYAKFTNEPGPMPSVCIGMWQNIWAMKSSDLGGDRAYIADFEVYDNRSIDKNNTILDIYIGIKKQLILLLKALISVAKFIADAAVKIKAYVHNTDGYYNKVNAGIEKIFSKNKDEDSSYSSSRRNSSSNSL